MQLTSLATTAVLAACALATPAAAQALDRSPGQVITPRGDPAANASNTSYRCGGVGDREQRQFKAEAARHDMMVTFATPTGAYLAGVDVTISTPAGAPLMQVHCDGPLMLVDLPRTGRYHVRASFQGQVQQKPVMIGDRTARLVFTWRES